MKLAEALANRAELQRRVEQMRMRLQMSARVQEDERLVSVLEGYVRRINRTNLPAALADGETIEKPRGSNKKYPFL